jgi:glycosyltransferase involved in cell wall biosynthesis
MQRVSIILATYNRPRDLSVTLSSVLKQSIKPFEILVIDDGDLQSPPLRTQFLRSGIGYTYIKKPAAQRGLTRSRNIGIEQARGDLIFFLDDDVYLFEDFLETCLYVYAAMPDIAGLGGVEIKPKARLKARLWFLFEAAFGITGFKKGRFLPSAFSTNLGNPVLPTRLSRVEFLGGASFSFRRAVFDTHRFCEDFQGYGLGEDKEFSYRISRTHPLICLPQARLYHYESPVMRYQKYEKARAKVLSKYRFLTRHNLYNRFKGFWFCYAMAGYLIKRTIIMCLAFDQGEVDRVRGILSGMKEILTLERQRRHRERP